MHKSHAKRPLNNRVLTNDLEKIKAAIAEATRDARGLAGDMLVDQVDSIKEKSAEYQGKVANYTTEKPLKALGIALAAGVVLGYLLRK